MGRKGTVRGSNAQSTTDGLIKMKTKNTLKDPNSQPGASSNGVNRLATTLGGKISHHIKKTEEEEVEALAAKEIVLA